MQGLTLGRIFSPFHYIRKSHPPQSLTIIYQWFVHRLNYMPTFQHVK